MSTYEIFSKTSWNYTLMCVEKKSYQNRVKLFSRNPHFGDCFCSWLSPNEAFGIEISGALFSVVFYYFVKFQQIFPFQKLSKLILWTQLLPCPIRLIGSKNCAVLFSHSINYHTKIHQNYVKITSYSAQRGGEGHLPSVAYHMLKNRSKNNEVVFFLTVSSQNISIRSNQ